MSRGGLCKHCGLEFKFLKDHIDRVHSESNDILNQMTINIVKFVATLICALVLVNLFLSQITKTVEESPFEFPHMRFAHLNLRTVPATHYAIQRNILGGRHNDGIQF